jgi:ketosteroid isomerase-like protein
MSENLDLVRSIYARWGGGDFSSAEWAHPEIEYVVADGPEPGTWTGVAAMAGAVYDELAAWEGFRFTAEEYRELDAERVLVIGHHSGRGKTSGVEVGEMQTKVAALFHICDKKVTRLVAYWDGDRALADVGLAD